MPGIGQILHFSSSTLVLRNAAADVFSVFDRPDLNQTQVSLVSISHEPRRKTDAAMEGRLVLLKMPYPQGPARAPVHVIKPTERREITRQKSVDGRRPASRQESDPKSMVVAPDHFAEIAPVVARHETKLEGVADVDLGVQRDLGAARRHIEHRAFAPGLAIVERQPGRPAFHLASRLALDLEPSLMHGHDDLPCWSG